jgi:hypothetical protein
MVGNEGDSNMPKRLPYEIAILVALLLGSCTQEGRTLSDIDSQADAAQANARTALSQNSEQGDRLDELERKVRNLERMDEAISADLESFVRRYNTHTH